MRLPLTVAAGVHAPGDQHGQPVLLRAAATFLVLVYCARPASAESDPVSRFMAGTSVLLVPVVLVLTWRAVVIDGSRTAFASKGNP